MRVNPSLLRSFVVSALLAGGSGSAVHAATFLVTTTGDGGGGSLRRAIQEANFNPGPDKILFAIPGLGVQTIRPLTPLPPLTERVTIDGSSQGSPDHLIVIDGSRLAPDAFGLELQGQGSWLHHMVLHGFGRNPPAPRGASVWLSGTGSHQVTDCRLGTDATGFVEVANRVGVHVTSPGNRIVDNLISASWYAGVLVYGADGTLIDRNLLGSNRDGRSFGAPSPTSQHWGVALYGSHNEIRRNTIGGSQGGIWMGGASDNVIAGNSIGISSIGDRLGDLMIGVYLDSLSNGNLIGGTAPGEANSFGHLGRPWTGGLLTFGYAVAVGSGTGNSIRGNQMFDLDPGAMVIDLGAPGPDANDWRDLDTGPNNLQNAPLLLNAWEDPWGPGVRVEGELYSGISSRVTYAIDVYATTAASPAGACETRRYLGTQVVNGDPRGGIATFSFLLPVTVDPGAMVSATATALSPNLPPETSELSPCVLVQ